MRSNAQEQIKNPEGFQHTMHLLKMVVVLFGINFLLFTTLLDVQEIFEVALIGIYVPALLLKLVNDLTHL